MPNPARVSRKGEIGGAEEDRTPDLSSAIAALSQLSYGPRAYNVTKKWERLQG